VQLAVGRVIQLALLLDEVRAWAWLTEFTPWRKAVSEAPA
jgi:hypothetical protein